MSNALSRMSAIACGWLYCIWTNARDSELAPKIPVNLLVYRAPLLGAQPFEHVPADQHDKRVERTLVSASPKEPDHCMCWPPLIAMLAPVRNAASSDARYAHRP